MAYQHAFSTDWASALPKHGVSIALCVLCIFLGRWLLMPYISSVAVEVLSWITNTYLLSRHSISAVESPELVLPTCPYRWPNGQGDIAKFLEGIENSASWNRVYGHIYRIWSGTSPEVVITRPEDVKTVFRDSHLHTKAVNNNAGYVMKALLGDCLGLIGHERHRRLRQAFEGPFSRTGSIQYIPLMLDSARVHCKDLFKSQKVRSSLEISFDKSFSLDPVGQFKMLPFRIVAQVLYGEDMGEAALAELLSMIPLREGLFMRIVRGGISRFWWARYLPLQVNRELHEFKTRWARFNTAMVAHNTSSIVARAFSGIPDSGVSDEEMLQTLDEMLFANLDVMMGGLSWSIVLLAAHNDCQTKICEEAKANQSSELDYIRSESTFLHACVLESARLRPLASFSVPQAAPTQRVVGSAKAGGSFAIPAGTDFIVDSRLLNVEQPFWGEGEVERRAFDPRRFLQCNRSEARYNYWRFGFGPRQCLGKHVADFIIKSTVVRLLERFELSLLDGCDEASLQLDTSSWISHPKVSLRCKARTPRKGD